MGELSIRMSLETRRRLAQNYPAILADIIETNELEARRVNEQWNHEQGPPAYEEPK